MGSLSNMIESSAISIDHRARQYEEPAIDPSPLALWLFLELRNRGSFHNQPAETRGRLDGRNRYQLSVAR